MPIHHFEEGNEIGRVQAKLLVLIIISQGFHLIRLLNYNCREGNSTNLMVYTKTSIFSFVNIIIVNISI